GDPKKTSCERAGLLSIGDTLLLLCEDVQPYRNREVEVRGAVVMGPRLEQVWREIEALAASGEVIHLSGETGTGKELSARLFHDASPRREGPFVPVNCAAIPPALAEGLLFGARRGAYSGAEKDTEGYLVAADGGTLFLDEIAE